MENTKTLTASEFLKTMVSKKQIEDQEDAENFILQQSKIEKTPLILHALIALGAFLTTVFFMFFLVVTEIITEKDHLRTIVISLMLTAAAIAIVRSLKEQNNGAQNFILQLSFMLMLTGKILFTFGLASLTENVWLIPLGILIISAPAYLLFPLSLDRYLSISAVLISTQLVMMYEKTHAHLFNALFLLALILASILVYLPYRKTTQPLLYAFITSMLYMVIYLSTQGNFILFTKAQYIQPIFINIILTISLIGLIIYAAMETGKLKSEPLILAFIGTITLSVISAPGIILSIILMVLGYLKHDRIILVLGILLMPVFLIKYYYSLELTLLYKAGILFTSGLVLLAGYGYIYFRGWNKGETS